MSDHGSTHRRDANHRAIVEAIEQECRLYFWDASQSNLGVDGFAVGRGRIVPVEFKHPKRMALTPHETEVHAVLKRYGITVEIITDTGTSLDVLRDKQNIPNLFLNTETLRNLPTPTQPYSPLRGLVHDFKLRQMKDAS